MKSTAPLWGTGVPVLQPPWPEEHVEDVVIGAGFTGLVTALLLARAGRSVVVLEARHVGAGASGATTGKVSLLQGTKLSQILQVHSEKIARAYLEANREGQAWLLDFCDTHGVPVDRRDAVTYAASPKEQSTARDEHDACRRLGLDVQWRTSLDVPFPVHGAAVLGDQAQLDPVPVLAALVAQLEDHGGRVFEGARVTDVTTSGELTVSTADGSSLRCDDVVVATGAPVLDRGLYFAKVEARRSYLLAFTGAQAPSQMLISAGSPKRSVRDAPDHRSTLLVGGNGHVTGQGGSEAERLDDLREWTTHHFPGAVESHAWSAQDHTTHDGIPFVGKMPRGRGRIYVATGYDKWGMSNSVGAARTISGEILDKPPSWSLPLGRRITHPRSALKLLTTNARNTGAAAVQLARAELRRPSPARDDEGRVGRDGLNPVPVATTTVDGETCRFTGLCTHLGGVLHWNDAEQTWDCPWHGSRFGPDGTVLDGPATTPLRRT